MKKALIALILILGALLPGCATPVESSQERSRRMRLQRNLECKMIVDDWDYLWLQERTSRLTQWHPYTGY